MKPSLTIPSIFVVLAVAVALSSMGVRAADSKAPPPAKHVWDHAALNRCSSPYKREVIADAQARDGQAVRFTGEAGFISMQAKPDATVHVAAVGYPLMLTRPYGQGQVCFVTAAPLGDAPAGEMAFWDWPEWPRLLGAVIRDLLSAEGEKSPNAAKNG